MLDSCAQCLLYMLGLLYMLDLFTCLSVLSFAAFPVERKMFKGLAHFENGWSVEGCGLPVVLVASANEKVTNYILAQEA